MIRRICLIIVTAGLAVLYAGCLPSADGTINTTEPRSETTGTTAMTATTTAEPPEEPSETTEPEPEPEFGTMEIVVFNVGKADAILIATENHAVMIDAGEEQHGRMIVEYLLNRGITVIDYMIITHFDMDHVGGAAEIIRSLDVREVIVPNYRRASRHYIRFREAMREKAIQPLILEAPDPLRFTLDGAMFTTFPSSLAFVEYIIDRSADEDEEERYYDVHYNEDDELPNVNNFSLVTSITHGNKSFLFTGDAKAWRIREILQTREIAAIDYDFLKVPHHGRYNRRSIDLINNISPTYAVITCSADRPADAEVVEALKAAGAQVYLTTNGGVYIISDGRSLKVEQR